MAPRTLLSAGLLMACSTSLPGAAPSEPELTLEALDAAGLQPDVRCLLASVPSPDPDTLSHLHRRYRHCFHRELMAAPRLCGASTVEVGDTPPPQGGAEKPFDPSVQGASDRLEACLAHHLFREPAPLPSDTSYRCTFGWWPTQDLSAKEAWSSPARCPR